MAIEEKYKSTHSGQQLDYSIDKILNLTVDSSTLNKVQDIFYDSEGKPITIDFENLSKIDVSADEINALDGISISETFPTIQSQLDSKLVISNVAGKGKEGNVIYPIYIDENGVGVAVTEYRGTVDKAVSATYDNNGNQIDKVYIRRDSRGIIEGILYADNWEQKTREVGETIEVYYVYDVATQFGFVPKEYYNITVSLSSNATIDQYKQFGKAGMTGTSVGCEIYALKKKPTLDIPVILNIECTYDKFYSNCLSFVANEAESSISMKVNGSMSKSHTFEYSTNGISWIEFIPGLTIIPLNNIGSRVYFRGDNSLYGVNESASNYYNFVMTGQVTAYGNIMSLIDNGVCSNRVIPTNYCFAYLFKDCSSLLTSPELTIDTLSANCFEGLFYNCSNLKYAPTLSALKLKDYCYKDMFNGCIGLTLAPYLKSTLLSKGCYYRMFNNTSIEKAPQLNATGLYEECYYGMFSNCTKLTTVPKLYSTTLQKDCYSEMFNGCSSLYLYSSSQSGFEVEWKIPQNYIGNGNYVMTDMFKDCGGDITEISPNFNNVQKSYFIKNNPV